MPLHRGGIIVSASCRAPDLPSLHQCALRMNSGCGSYLPSVVPQCLIWGPRSTPQGESGWLPVLPVTTAPIPRSLASSVSSCVLAYGARRFT